MWSGSELNNAVNLSHTWTMVPLKWLRWIIWKEKKEEKWDKTKIWGGSFATAKVGYMENTREGDIKRMINELVGCVLVSQCFPNMLAGMVFPWLPTEVEITCNLLVTLFLCCSILFRRDRIVSQYQGGGLVAFGGQQTSIHMISCGSLLTKKWRLWLSNLNRCRWWLASSFQARRDFCTRGRLEVF